MMSRPPIASSKKPEAGSAGAGKAGAGKLRAVALDLDGTAKTEAGPLNPVLADRLAKLRTRGIRVILATGRSVAELEGLVDFGMFDAIVAENGTVLVVNGQSSVLAPASWLRTRDELTKVLGRGSERVVISLSREMLEKAERLVKGRAKIELNKDRIMIMPEGFDKGRGLVAALKEMGISKGVACIGDGENDLSMFEVSDYRVALQNSVGILKEKADYIASHSDGEGAVEAMDELMLR